MARYGGGWLLGSLRLGCGILDWRLNRCGLLLPFGLEPLLRSTLPRVTLTIPVRLGRISLRRILIITLLRILMALLGILITLLSWGIAVTLLRIIVPLGLRVSLLGIAITLNGFLLGISAVRALRSLPLPGHPTIVLRAVKLVPRLAPPKTEPSGPEYRVEKPLSQGSPGNYDQHCQYRHCYPGHSKTPCGFTRRSAVHFGCFF
ncbi:MAG: hypothetical protein AB1733_07000 [Thermodesulfobacteriota bacterium]